MNYVTESLSFLVQVFAVVFVAGCAWQASAAIVIDINEHVRNRLLAIRLRQSRDETIESMRRAGDVIPLREICCMTYAATGGVQHGTECVWSKAASAARAVTN